MYSNLTEFHTADHLHPPSLLKKTDVRHHRSRPGEAAAQQTMEVDPDAPVATTGNAVLDGVGVAASAAVAAVTGNEEPAGDEQWTRIELFVIASLQLVLVLVAYRLDRQAHPALISESAWAVFFGVLVRALGLLAEVVESTTDWCGMPSCWFWCGSLARRCASSRPWCVGYDTQSLRPASVLVLLV